MYFQCSADGVAVYGGVYAAQNDVLHRIRTYISGHAAEFADAYNDAAFRETYGAVQGETQKRLPPELADAAKREPLIANKQFYFMASYPADTAVKADFADILVACMEAGKPVNDFLKKAMQADG